MLQLTDLFGDPDVIAFISDRTIDFSLDPQKPYLSQTQSEWIAQLTGSFSDDLAWFRQVHGREVLVFENKPERCGVELPQADGALTNQKGIPLAIRTADCLPVFIFDPLTKSIGLIHAGWRGTKEGILKNAVERMGKSWKTRPQDLKIVLGPAIRSCCYQVGPEFTTHFPSETFERDGSLFFDLIAANRTQLRSLQIAEDKIFDCGICTSCDQRFFSHRRDKEKAGRMISILMLKP